MSASASLLKTSFMLSPLYHPATATGRVAGRLVNSTIRASTSALRVGVTPTTNGFLHNDRKQFSTTPSQQLKAKEFFPPLKNEKILKSPATWPHPVYTEEQMQEITVQHREAKTVPDKIAFGLMRLARWGLDTATLYAKEKHIPAANDSQPGSDVSRSAATSASAEKSASWLRMDERKWLIRIVFLESIAGVPGMVGGMLRHLHSLRRMKRDNGWIETLLEESFNERMHLLTFIKIAEPGLFMRTMILLAQGVFFNGFTAAYLVAPRACHRFVGYLEEEAVYTYSRIIREVESGALPKWADPKFEIPDIAVDYWKIPEGKRTMRDLLYYVRADEAKHREVNHTLGNLDQKADPNPYTSEYTQVEKDKPKALPSKGIDTNHQLGWERNEIL